jgi:bacterioferritin B
MRGRFREARNLVNTRSACPIGRGQPACHRTDRSIIPIHVLDPLHPCDRFVIIDSRKPKFAFHKNFLASRIDRGKRVHSLSRHRSRRLRRASVGLFSQLQSPVVGERLLYMVANQKIVAAINEQMGNEFSAMLQYYAIAAHFGAEGLRELSAHFYKQAEEEKEHALRFIQFVIDTGARVKIPAVSAPQAHFEVAEDAVKLSLEQEEQVTTQINALVSMAKAESDYTADNFLQWFIKEQLEEVASMGQLLRVVQRAGEGNLLRVEEYLAREKDGGAVLSEEQ